MRLMPQPTSLRKPSAKEKALIVVLASTLWRSSASIRSVRFSTAGKPPPGRCDGTGA